MSSSLAWLLSYGDYLSFGIISLAVLAGLLRLRKRLIQDDTQKRALFPAQAPERPLLQNDTEVSLFGKLQTTLPLPGDPHPLALRRITRKKGVTQEQATSLFLELNEQRIPVEGPLLLARGSTLCLEVGSIYEELRPGDHVCIKGRLQQKLSQDAGSYREEARDFTLKGSEEAPLQVGFVGDKAKRRVTAPRYLTQVLGYGLLAALPLSLAGGIAYHKAPLSLREHSGDFCGEHPLGMTALATVSPLHQKSAYLLTGEILAHQCYKKEPYLTVAAEKLEARVGCEAAISFLTEAHLPLHITKLAPRCTEEKTRRPIADAFYQLAEFPKASELLDGLPPSQLDAHDIEVHLLAKQPERALKTVQGLKQHLPTSNRRGLLSPILLFKRAYEPPPMPREAPKNLRDNLLDCMELALQHQIKPNAPKLAYTLARSSQGCALLLFGALPPQEQETLLRYWPAADPPLDSAYQTLMPRSAPTTMVTPPNLPQQRPPSWLPAAAPLSEAQAMRLLAAPSRLSFPAVYGLLLSPGQMLTTPEDQVRARLSRLLVSSLVEPEKTAKLLREGETLDQLISTLLDPTKRNNTLISQATAVSIAILLRVGELESAEYLLGKNGHLIEEATFDFFSAYARAVRQGDSTLQDLSSYSYPNGVISVPESKSAEEFLRWLLPNYYDKPLDALWLVSAYSSKFEKQPIVAWLRLWNDWIWPRTITELLPNLVVRRDIAQRLKDEELSKTLEQAVTRAAQGYSQKEIAPFLYALESLYRAEANLW